METTKPVKNQGVQVISRAADILRLLGKQTNGMSLGQIAVEVQLPRSTVQRIVSALADEGFISNTTGNGSIRLGPEIQNLASVAVHSMQQRLRLVMKRLSEQTGETVDLAILEGNHMRFIDQVEGSQRLRAVSSIGERFPLTTTANGKAALACIDRTVAIGLIQTEIGIEKSESKSLKSDDKSLKQFLTELDDIQAGKLAKDENEHTEGICALGVAFKDDNGDVYAISIPVPSTRYARVKDTIAVVIQQHVTAMR